MGLEFSENLDQGVLIPIIGFNNNTRVNFNNLYFNFNFFNL